MTQTLSNAKATMLLYRMQIAWFLLFTFNALGASALTALTGTQWGNADPQTKIMIFIGIFVSWANTMMALFSESMKRVQSGDLPFASTTDRDTDTTRVQTAVITTKEVTTTTPHDNPTPPASNL